MTATENGSYITSNEAPRSWDDILLDLETKGPVKHAVEIPEWGTRVYVRGLTRNEQLRLTKLTTVQKGGGKTDTNTELADQILFLTGVVEPKPTKANYDRLKMDPEANRILARIHNAITKLTGIEEGDGTQEATDAEDERLLKGEDESVTAAKSYLKSAP